MAEQNQQSFSSDQSNQSDNSQGSSFNKDGGEMPKTFEELGISIEDVVALQKRDVNAQAHITKLEAETSDLRDNNTKLEDEAAKNLLIQDALDGNDADDNQTGLSEEDLLKKALAHVKDSLNEEKAVGVKAANFKSVTEALTEAYGEGVDKHIASVCDELGMSWEDAVKLSEDKPAAALKLFSGTKKINKQSTQQTMNTSAFQSTDNQEKPVNVMGLRTDRARVDNFLTRLAAASNA